MKQWLPSQPLILTPIIPLMWTTGWACMASAYTVLEIQPPYSAQLQESILLISSVILVANIYNLILISQRIERYRDYPTYGPRTLLLAIVLIISIVMAWGQPKAILVPNRLTFFVVAFIILNFLQALLGEFFTLFARPVTRRKPASMYLPTVTLCLSGLIIPACVNVHDSWQLPLMGCGCSLLIYFTWETWQNLPGILSKGSVNNSIMYELLVGINLASAILAIISGVLFFVFSMVERRFIFSLYCFVISLPINGISGLLISALQRYNNDYRYGHVKGKPQRYIYCGMLIMVIFIIAVFYLVA